MERNKSRSHKLHSVEDSSNTFDIVDDPHLKHENDAVSWWWPVCALAAGLGLFYFVYVQSQTLPKIITAQESEESATFCGERSRNILTRLTDLGPKVFGEVENEIRAPEIIEDELQKIIKGASSAQSIRFQRQKGSGSYFLAFKMPFFNVYNDAQNVMATIEGGDGNHSILVNCHYDSVPLSPGASDDGISCATMLEILRILSLSPKRLSHNVVFLFNGAEESPLQAAHLFLSHEWAKKCRIVINLEAGGVGGRNILFQSGPGHPWLLKYYANNVPHPHGQVLGEELFQSGAIPSDTDFRIFRDFGGMPGMDFAFWQSGHIYHTSYDSQNQIPAGSYQHIGDNTLALIRALGNANELNDLDKNSQGQMVYYDYLGWFMLSYSDSMNIIVNTGTLLLGISSIMVFIGRPNQWRSIRELIYRLCIILGGMISTILSAVLIGVLLNIFAPYVMPWYLNPIIVFPLYWCPGLAAFILTTNLLENKMGSKCKLSMYSVMHMNMIASQIPWISLLFLTTIIGIRSSSLFFAPVFFGAVSNLIVHLTPLKRRAYQTIWMHLLIHIPVLLYNMYFVMTLYMIIVPILGRSGPINGEIVIAILSSLLTIFVFSFVLPFMIMVKNPKRTIFILVSICLLSMIWVGISGPPYSASLSDPRPQRYLIIHTHRQFRDKLQQISKSDNRFIIYNLDRNSPNTVPIDKHLIHSVANDCDSELFCGIPMLTSRTIVVSDKSSWIQADPPYLYIDTEVMLKNDTPKCNKQSSTCELSLTVKGPNRLTLILVPRPGVSLFEWSVNTMTNSTAKWNDRPVHFVHITCGTYECEYPITLSFNVTEDQLRGSPFVDAVLSGHYINRKRNMITKQFQDFLNEFPDWAHVTAWASAHRMYVF